MFYYKSSRAEARESCGGTWREKYCGEMFWKYFNQIYVATRITHIRTFLCWKKIVQKPAARARSWMCKNLQPEHDLHPKCHILSGFAPFWHIWQVLAHFWHIFGTLRQPSEIVGRLVLSGGYKPSMTSRFWSRGRRPATMFGLILNQSALFAWLVLCWQLLLSKINWH